MFQDESQREQLLALIAVSGDFPQTLLPCLGSLSYKQKLITALKQEKLITVYYRDGIKSYRLTAKAKRQLLSANPVRFTPYLTGNAETNLYRGDITRRLRLHRIAETYIMMYQAGIKIYRDDKTPVFTSSVDSVYPVEKQSVQSLKLPAFYSSHEVKALGMESIKIKNSRAVGVLLTETTPYIVFNTRDTLINWESRSESKNLAVIFQFLRQTLDGYVPGSIKALMIGRSMETAGQILRSTGGFKRRYLMLDDTFYNMPFLPHQSEGVMVLRILSDAALQAETRSILMYGLTAATDAIVDCDGIDPAGIPVLIAYDCDLQRIARFNAALSNRNRKGIIFCFDFQAGILTGYCNPDYITVRTISSEKYRRRFSL